MKIVAILSSSLIFEGTTCKCESVEFPSDLTGILSYVGHPATKALLEQLGAVQAPTNLFTGLAVGESFLAVPLATNTREGGYTKDVAISDVSQLKAKLVTRLA